MKTDIVEPSPGRWVEGHPNLGGKLVESTRAKRIINVSEGAKAHDESLLCLALEHVYTWHLFRKR
jgi:hypothetical protein